MLTSDEAITRLRAAGYRVTPQRRAVIAALEGNVTHPSADSVARHVSEQLPGVSLSTVYKTLHEFAQAGMIRELDVSGTLRFDPEPADHAHVVCDRCGRVDDMVLPPDTGAALQRAAGVPVRRIDVTLHAVCPPCSEA
ncbi:MAG: Fur family transcriptional regulator [Coriobacteriia bacterium]|nr:Fur family transcriptional regulator [Coriobacteriia bacterium]